MRTCTFAMRPVVVDYGTWRLETMSGRLTRQSGGRLCSSWPRGPPGLAGLEPLYKHVYPTLNQFPRTRIQAGKARYRWES